MLNICYDACHVRFPHKARLVYADPPTNRGMNEGGASDRLPEGLYYQFALEWLSNSLLQLNNSGRLVICCYWKIRWIYEKIIKERFSWLKFESEIIWNYNFGLYTTFTVVPSHDNILVYRVGKPPYNWFNTAVKSQRLQTGDSRANPMGRNVSSVWNIPRQPGNSLARKFVRGTRRSCQPLTLCTRLLLLYTNPYDIVHDMFSGTGTMAKACQITQRDYFGCDICQDYVDEANERVTKHDE